MGQGGVAGLPTSVHQGSQVPLHPKLGWWPGPRLVSAHANEMLILKTRLAVASKCLGTLLTAREAPQPLWAARALSQDVLPAIVPVTSHYS